MNDNLLYSSVRLKTTLSFLQSTIKKYIEVGQIDFKEIESKFSSINLPRKSLVIRAGEIANKLILIEDGYLRMYRIDPAGKETTVWIGGEGKFITAISSFIDRKPSRWNIEAITDSKLHVIKTDSHFELCKKFRQWQDFESLLLAKALGALEFRTFELMSLKADERFRLFFENNHQLFLDIPAKYIASFLGISEETLSRLRKDR